MNLHGDISINAAPEAVWASIISPISLARCIPGVQDIRQVNDRTFEGMITAAVGPIEGNFAFRSELTTAQFPDDLVVEVEGNDSATNSRLEMDIRAALAACDGGTRLEYRAVVKVKGRLAILGEMVLRATAGMMIGEVTKCLRSHLETGVTPEPASVGAVAGDPDAIPSRAE